MSQVGDDLTYHVDLVIVSYGLKLAVVLVANGVRGGVGDIGLGGVGVGLRRAAFGVWLAKRSHQSSLANNFYKEIGSLLDILPVLFVKLLVLL